MKKNLFAFTLAEVLITLGIIGVVAAMTLPGLIQNYQKNQTANQLKKVYSLINQAFKMAEVDYESFKYWDFSLSNKAFTDKYLKPYIKTTQEYESGVLPQNVDYYCRRGVICNGYGALVGGTKLVLPDGTILLIAKTANGVGTNFVTIVVNLNGLKKPNQYGRDLFAFSLQGEKGVVPYGVGFVSGGNEDSEYNRNTFLNGSDSRACNKDGIYCAAVIMMDGWEIKNDYMW